MLNANLPTSVSDMADKFNHTEKDIMRALLYWESKNLLALDFDSNKNLVGISLKDLFPERMQVLWEKMQTAFLPVRTRKLRIALELEQSPF